MLKGERHYGDGPDKGEVLDEYVSTASSHGKGWTMWCSNIARGLKHWLGRRDFRGRWKETEETQGRFGVGKRSQFADARETVEYETGYKR
ncbi:hypothetical protein VTH06DRAFT_6797 [Thermothelomyces fergusii]